jgi:hypothetical protein
MSPDQAAQIVHRALASYPTQRQRMTREDIAGMMVAYTAGLQDLEFELVRSALDRVVRSSQWLPTIAELRSAAGVLVHGVQKTGAEAWGSVLRAVGEKGSHRTPGVDFTFNDPITRRVVTALGWVNLCKSEDLTPDRARFIDAYEQIAKNERVEAKASPGLASKAFSPEDLPVAIGREAPAMKQLEPPDERSRQLREAISEARAASPERAGVFANEIMKKLGEVAGGDEVH